MKSNKMVKTKRMYAPQSGQNAIWDGPLNVDVMLRGYGSSSGCKGIQLLAKNMPAYIPGPISQIAKGKYGEGMD